MGNAVVDFALGFAGLSLLTTTEGPRSAHSRYATAYLIVMLACGAIACTVAAVVAYRANWRVRGALAKSGWVALACAVAIFGCYALMRKALRLDVV